MDFKNKYLKYKNKYLNLKKKSLDQKGGLVINVSSVDNNLLDLAREYNNLLIVKKDRKILINKFLRKNTEKTDNIKDLARILKLDELAKNYIKDEDISDDDISKISVEMHDYYSRRGENSMDSASKVSEDLDTIQRKAPKYLERIERSKREALEREKRRELYTKLKKNREVEFRKMDEATSFSKREERIDRENREKYDNMKKKLDSNDNTIIKYKKGTYTGEFDKDRKKRQGLGLFTFEDNQVTFLGLWDNDEPKVGYLKSADGSINYVSSSNLNLEWD